jgi:ascorbate-specific PTS system EIIC-type component UlaA
MLCLHAQTDQTVDGFALVGIQTWLQIRLSLYALDYMNVRHALHRCWVRCLRLPNYRAISIITALLSVFVLMIVVTLAAPLNLSTLSRTLHALELLTTGHIMYQLAAPIPYHCYIWVYVCIRACSKWAHLAPIAWGGIDRVMALHWCLMLSIRSFSWHPNMIANSFIVICHWIIVEWLGKVLGPQNNNLGELDINVVFEALGQSPCTSC